MGWSYCTRKTDLINMKWTQQESEFHTDSWEQICINEWSCSLWKAKIHLRIYLNWLMIKHDSDICMSYCLPYVTTDLTSMQWSTKDDRLGYLNLQHIKTTLLITSFQDVFSEFTFLMNAACCLSAHTPAAPPDWQFSCVILISMH